MEAHIDASDQCSSCWYFVWIFLYVLFPKTFCRVKNIYSCILLITASFIYSGHSY